MAEFAVGTDAAVFLARSELEYCVLAPAPCIFLHSQLFLFLRRNGAKRMISAHTAGGVFEVALGAEGRLEDPVLSVWLGGSAVVPRTWRHFWLEYAPQFG